MRDELLTHAKRIVVKIGSSLIASRATGLRPEQIERLADEIAALRASGREVLVVSSGAIVSGIKKLQLKEYPKSLPIKQAAAAVGQSRLIWAYEKAFERLGIQVAQILLTHQDLEDRRRFLNARYTLTALIGFGVLPIINENDTVAVDELMITFGDNDRLAAMVSSLLRAELLVILSDVPGLYNGDPSSPESQLISTVKKIDDTILGYVRDQLTGLSKGGMASKLNAAKIITSAGEHCLIASGRQDDVLTQIIAGEPIGTLFLPRGKTISPFKRWLGFSAQPKGRLSVDDGARRAIVEQGKSLLAIGVAHVEGKFRKGDVVALYDSQANLIGRGLTNYDLDDLERIKGLRSEKVTQVLGTEAYAEVVHRDNLVVVD